MQALQPHVPDPASLQVEGLGLEPRALAAAAAPVCMVDVAAYLAHADPTLLRHLQVCGGRELGVSLVGSLIFRLRVVPCLGLAWGSAMQHRDRTLAQGAMRT